MAVKAELLGGTPGSARIRLSGIAGSTSLATMQIRRNQGTDVRSKTGILELYEFDKLRANHILKLNPMANWSREAVWEYIKENKIPYNPLHDRGYRTIGCWPCTKVAGGESERAGPVFQVIARYAF